MDTQFILLILIILIIILIVNIYRITKKGFSLEENKIGKGFEWIFQLDSLYLSTTMINFAIPFHMETGNDVTGNDQMFGHFSTMIMLLRYFRRRSSVVPYRGADVNHGRCSSTTDSPPVVCLRRERVLDNIAVGLHNAMLRDIFQGVPRHWHNRHNCKFCRAIYRNLTPSMNLPIIRQWLERTIPDGMERHTDGHFRQFLLPEISNARPHDLCCQRQGIRHVWISTQRLTLLFPYIRFLHDNPQVTFDSTSFFVRGLRLCLRVYLNGVGDGRMSHMSVFLVFAEIQMLCCNDWRFPLAIRVTLVANQRRYTNMAYTVVVRNPRSWFSYQSIYEFGFEMFVSYHLLEHYFIRDGVVTFIIALDD